MDFSERREPLLRDRLVARLRGMGDDVDHQRLVAEVLGIHGAPPALARKLVAQALVLEDRREWWRRTGERISREAPTKPGVYTVRDDEGRALYVGKAVNLRRRLRAHFSARRWRAAKPAFARAAAAEWIEVGSELEALLREASLIDELKPLVNVQVSRPALDTRQIPAAIIRDTVVVAPSIEEDSAELIGARVEGAWMIQRTRRNGADVPVHAQRLWRFFFGAMRRESPTAHTAPLAPIVFSWLAHRGAGATRLDVHALENARDLRQRLEAMLRDERLFRERLEQW